MTGPEPTDPGDQPAAAGMRLAPVQPALLESIMRDALDPAYTDAAGRERRRPARTKTAATLLLLVGGLGVGVAVGHQRTEAPTVAQTREALVTNARQRMAAVVALTDQVQQLRRQTSSLQASATNGGQQGRLVEQQRAELSVADSETPLTGPGVEVVVDDAAGAAPVPGAAERRPDGSVLSGRVQDRDLQDAVNALWAAGAEAVAVGGVRLSPVTAIRTAGQTILADFQPLTAPYTLVAIGDPTAMPGRFRSVAAQVLGRLRDEGIAVRVSLRPSVSVPAASGAESRVARPLGSGSPTEGARP